MLLWLKNIKNVLDMCDTNLGGQFVLRFLPRAGGYFDQPAEEIELIQTIIKLVNTKVSENKPKNPK